MKNKKIVIPVLILGVLVGVFAVVWIRQKSKEREVLVSQEVIGGEATPEGRVAEGLVDEEITEDGRNFQLRLVAEVRANPRRVYDTLVDFDHLKDLIPDCSKLEVVQAEGNKTIIYVRRFVLFMGKEMGGNLEYVLNPEELKFDRRVLRDPNANLQERWTIEAKGGKARVTYVADVKPKLKVPIFIAQAWLKDDFVDLMKAVKDKLENESASG